MEAIRPSEPSVLIRATRRNIREDGILGAMFSCDYDLCFFFSSVKSCTCLRVVHTCPWPLYRNGELPRAQTFPRHKMGGGLLMAARQ
jgi:hypothetical protein